VLGSLTNLGPNPLSCGEKGDLILDALVEKEGSLMGTAPRLEHMAGDRHREVSNDAMLKKQDRGE